MKDTPIYPKRTFNFKGILHSFDRPAIMGILNITPDSFYAPSRLQDSAAIRTRVEGMLNAGVDILDVGGYSSRPGAQEVSESDEIERVVPVIEKLIAQFPDLLISVDTFRSKVADLALTAGASMVNDISGGALDDSMYAVVAKHHVPYVMMHMRGTPQTMGNFTDYDDLIGEMMRFFGERIRLAQSAGIKDIIIDPGFGFSKTQTQNFEVMKNLSFFSILKCPVLVGVSRKSMVYKSLNLSPDQSLNGTTVMNTVALLNGADFLRVHDVAEASQAINLLLKTGLIN